MGKVVVSLQDKDIQELNEIIMDSDGENALKFLKEKILSQVQRHEKGKLNVEGKTHL
jgi:hypothetical protein